MAGTVTVVFGTQFGDEGKARIVDYLAQNASVVVRYNGGDNAGHTIVIGANGQQRKLVLHYLPSGIVRPGVVNVLGRGMVLSPGRLITEMEQVHSAGFPVTPKSLIISPGAHLTLSFHQALENAEEDEGDRRNTTRRGISPTYAFKHLYQGVRVCDLAHLEHAQERVRQPLAHANAILERVYERDTVAMEVVMAELEACVPHLLPFVRDEAYYLKDRLTAGEHVLCEGAQGLMLDVDLGIYPYSTSSNTTPAAVNAGAGIDLLRWDTQVVGVAKAYISRVGDGPLVAEIRDERGETIRERGNEYGATTGRPRRIAWFDAMLANHCAVVCRPTKLAITKIDILSGIPIEDCYGYRMAGERVRAFPVSMQDLAACEPVLGKVPGWDRDITGATYWDDLPPRCQQYLEMIGEAYKAPIGLVSTGPERSQLIVR